MNKYNFKKLTNRKWNKSIRSLQSSVRMQEAFRQKFHRFLPVPRIMVNAVQVSK